MRFYNFPGEFECAINGTRTQPSFQTRLEVGYDGKYTRCLSNSGCPKIEFKRPKQFEKLAETIRKILDSKDQIRNAAETDIIFL